MSVNASNKRPRPVITVVSARPLSEVGFRDNTPTKPLPTASGNDVKVQQAPARPGAPPGRPQSWKQTTLTQSAKEPTSLQPPKPAPRGSISSSAAASKQDIPEQRKNTALGLEFMNYAFENELKESHPVKPEPLLISFDDEPLHPVQKANPDVHPDLLTPPVYAVVNKKTKSNAIQKDNIDSLQSSTPPQIPPSSLDVKRVQTESSVTEDDSVTKLLCDAQFTPLVLLNKNSALTPSQKISTEAHGNSPSLNEGTPYSSISVSNKKILNHGVPVFPTSVSLPPGRTMAEQHSHSIASFADSSSSVRPKPAVKPKPALKPKPVFKPKPSVKAKPASNSAPVIPPDSSGSGTAMKIGQSQQMQRTERLPGTTKLSAEDDEIARKTKEQETSVHNIISAMRARLEKSQAEGNSESAPKPMKATYRPTIIKPQVKKSTEKVDLEVNEFIPDNEAHHVSTDLKPAAVLGPSRKRPTIIRPQATSQNQLKADNTETAPSTDSMRTFASSGQMSSAISMPNLVDTKMQSGAVAENWLNISSADKVQNMRNEALACKLGLETREQKMTSLDRTSQINSGDKTVPFTGSSDETNFPEYEDIEPPVCLTKSVGQGKLPPPRPSSGPQGESADPVEKSSSQPPARPTRSPGSVRTRTGSLSSEMKPGPPPELPPRPGPGHPLFHYVVSEPHAIAVFDYEASHDDELSFKAGDVILLMSWVNDQWLHGRLMDREGIFPGSFVDVVKPPPDSAECAAVKQKPINYPQSPELKKSDTGLGPRCIARFDYDGEESEDLTFETGDVIKLLARVGDEWLKGELAGRTGIFPASYIEIIEDLPEEQEIALSKKTGNVVTAVYDFDGGTNELSFKSGDKISILSQVNKDWLFGEIGDKKGSFPSSFVDWIPAELPEQVPELSQAAKQSTQTSQKTSDAYCIATYDYNSDSPDDLCFTKGQKITLLSIINDDWLKGSIGERVGIFPKDFVQVVKDVDELPQMPKDVSVPAEETNTPRALAKFDFSGEADGDLSFTTGQEIILLERLSDDWLRGRIGIREGMFPAAYVDTLVPL